MKIKYFGHSSFKISGKTSTGADITIVTDPFNEKDVGIPYSTQEADIVTISHQHKDHNALDKIKGTPGDDYFVADTPGEYEIKGLRILGLKSFHDNKEGAERGKNTIFIFDFADGRIAHLGDLGHELSSDQQEQIENIDVLLTPVGGIYTIGPKSAKNVIEDIEPLVVIPMHYKTDKHIESFKELATLDDFLKESGSQAKPEKELIIKSSSDLPENLKIIPLEF